jgi:eukaryotic-like serine/threonine-protein kinase
MRCPQCHRRLAGGAACPVDGSRPAEAVRPETERPDIPGYQLLSLIGRGGFARVYAARRTAGGDEVAIKVGEASATERFEREAFALGRLPPGVAPRLLQNGLTGGGEPFLALELLRGESLAEFLASLPGTGALARAEALKLFDNVCEPVARMHAAGIVHRDLKPENVFLKPEGGVALLDLGLARLTAESGPGVAETLTRTAQRLGTAHYMAPEQCLEAREAVPASDVYSLGVILFEMLTGRPPFVGEEAEILHAHVSRRPPRPSAFVEVEAALDEVVTRCLNKSPALRFRSASDLRDALQRASREAASLVSTASVQPEGKSRTSRRAVALLGVNTGLPLPEVLAAAAHEGGELVRIHADGYLFLFHRRSHLESALRAAARAGQQLLPTLGSSDSVVLHVGEVSFRSKGSETVPFGSCLERPRDWWPKSEPSALNRTREAEVLLGDPWKEDEAVSSPISTRAPAFRGRDELRAALSESHGRAWSERLPTLTTITGEVGLGKTRLLDTIFAGIPCDVRVLRVSVRPPDAHEPEAAFQSLLRQALELPESNSSLDDLRKRCRERLPSSAVDMATLAAALSVGLIPEGDQRASQLLSVPGAARHLAAKTVAQAIRSLASRQRVAVLIDDAHWADPTTLDALEIATLSGDAISLWICATALPSLLTIRPFWGDRAASCVRHELRPLTSDASRAVLKDLLQPIEFVPEPILGKLSAIGCGVPLSLVELVAALRREGAIRRASEKSELYLAADDLLRPSSIPFFERIADRTLNTLPAQLSALAQLCAVAGDELTVDEIDSAQQLLSTRKAERPAIDSAVGLVRLVRAGLLKQIAEHRFGFPHPLIRESLEARIPYERRKQLHSVLLSVALRSSANTVSISKIARHAAASEDCERAYEAHFVLAEDARLHHKDVEAEQHYTAALAQLRETDAQKRLAAITGRGKTRYRSQRFQDALQDLRSARSLAERGGTTSQVLDLLLEEATVLDWLEDWEGSFGLVETALSKIHDVTDTRLQLKAELARGRMHRRRDQLRQALEVLEPMIRRANELGDQETMAIGQLLVAGILIVQNSFAEAESCFDRLLSACDRTGDDLHAGAALCLRVFLWLKRGSIKAAFDDLHAAIRKARELGNAQLERFASFNLAQCLYWSGEYDQALSLARRAHELGRRFFVNSPTPTDALLLARIFAVKGDPAAAREQFEWVKANCQQTTSISIESLLVQLTELLTSPPSSTGQAKDADRTAHAWNDLVLRAREQCVIEDDYMEILWSAADWALKTGRGDDAKRWLLELEKSLPRSPLWRLPFEKLSAVLQEM